MDELSPLFQEIEFHERYRGYDPDEVDAFVDRVARAAAVMRGRITELHERVEAAEARGGVGAASSDTEETLTRTLVLAQRTADAAIAEAREEADRLTTDAATSAQTILSAAEAEARLTLKDAEDRAGLILAEAETDRRAMVADAEAFASEAAAAERERLAAEVAELHEYRAFLADDIEILERHLTEERHQLTASLSALTDLLESPEAFRVSRPPATSGLEIDQETLGSSAAPGPVAEDEPMIDEPVVDEPVVDEPIADEPVAVEEPAEVEESVALDESGPIDDGTIDLVAAEAVIDPPAHDDIDDEVVYTEIDLADSDPDPQWGPGTGGGEGPESHPEPQTSGEPAFAGMVESAHTAAPQAEPAPSRLVTAADLEPSVAQGGRLGFETSSFDRLYDDGGPDTEAVPALQDGSLFAEPETADDPFLAQLRDAVDNEPLPQTDDDALSAFFDQEDDDSSRSWFGRRR